MTFWGLRGKNRISPNVNIEEFIMTPILLGNHSKQMFKGSMAAGCYVWNCGFVIFFWGLCGTNYKTYCALKKKKWDLIWTDRFVIWDFYEVKGIWAWCYWVNQLTFGWKQQFEVPYYVSFLMNTKHHQNHSNILLL